MYVSDMFVSLATALHALAVVCTLPQVYELVIFATGNLNREEAEEMLLNMQLAASEVDSVLVQLLSKWAERGRDGSPCSQVQYVLTSASTETTFSIHACLQGPSTWLHFEAC